MKNGTMKMWGYKLSRKNKVVKKKGKKDPELWRRAGFLMPYFVGGLVCFIVAASITLFFRYYFLNSPTFEVKYIAVNKSSTAAFTNGEASLDKRYLGRNIFSVIPSQVEMLLREEYPNLKMIRVRRVFPDTIEVDLVSRESFACLDTAGGIVLDKLGMILSVGDMPEGIVIVKGINFFLRPQPGVVLKDKNVETALSVIDIVLKKARIRRSDLEVVDVADLNNVWVTVKGIPVNLGNEEFEKKTNTLGDILADKNIDLSGVKYIDLRFKDPVYSYKRN